jgi:hypothetical protein
MSLFNTVESSREDAVRSAQLPPSAGAVTLPVQQRHMQEGFATLPATAAEQCTRSHHKHFKPTKRSCRRPASPHMLLAYSEHYE